MYHDNVTALDYLVGDVLESLEKNGMVENTVLIFFGDHGWGLSRGKRWLYDSGLRCPLIVRWPGTIKPGSVRDDLVAFVDIAPTILSLAGVEVAPRYQGQPFLGEKIKERKYVYAARDRMDETFDRIRAVRDKRYKYIRNFYPELPYAQWINYMDEMPILKEWRRLNQEGKLTGPQKLFFAAQKPKEELYDCELDPHEINNLIADAKYAQKRDELRQAMDDWIKSTKDLGEVPEDELIRRGIVRDVLPDYRERLKQHPSWSKASALPPEKK